MLPSLPGSTSIPPEATPALVLILKAMDDDLLDDLFDPALAAILPDNALEPPLLCSRCSSPLTGDTDDQPYWPDGPLCANCYQAMQMDDEIAWSEGF